MDLNDIKVLIEAMQSSDLAEMEFSRNGWTLRLVRNTGHNRQPANPNAGRPVESPLPGPAQPDMGRAVTPAPLEGDVRAPLSGIVHLQPAPDQPPFIQAGQSVQAGAMLCIIEAMEVFNSIRAERDGTVEAVLVAPGDEVEAGQTLMRIV
jgi:acetyl-CoA carboxylase biotin carboxyl carrier protein